MHAVLVELAIYLAAAVLAVPVSRRLGFGSVLGYIAAGMAIGPALGLVGDTVEIQHFAEYGVVLMLFLIGLEMRPRMLWDLRHRLLGLGGLQVALTVALLAAASRGAGLPWNQAAAVGMVLALSSTAIVMQTLGEKKLLRTEGGRASFAVLLFQDLAALPLLALVPLLALGTGQVPVADLHGGGVALDDVSPWTYAALVVGAVAAVILAGRYLTRPVYHFLSWAQLPEIHVAGALLMIVGVSLVMVELGLSPALGSFLAGVVLAGSEYRHQLEADIAPFKGVLLGLFFITVGAGVDLARLADDLVPILGFVALMLAMKMAVLWALGVAFGLPPPARLLFTLGLAQAGEFGFVLLGFAQATRVLSPDQAATVLLVIALSMVATPALFALHDVLARRGGTPDRAAEVIDERGPVIIAGMGRFGQVANRLVAGMGHRTVVIDNRPDTVRRMRAQGIRAYLGDVGRPELLEAAGIAEAAAVILAADDPQDAVRLAGFISRRYPDVRIVARARDRHHVYQLHAAGADDSVRELFESGLQAGAHALAALGHDRHEVEAAVAELRRQDGRMLAELAPLWDPDVPNEENAAYLAREREQLAAIEAALRRHAARPAAPEGKSAE